MKSDANFEINFRPPADEGRQWFYKGPGRTLLADATRTYGGRHADVVTSGECYINAIVTDTPDPYVIRYPRLREDEFFAARETQIISFLNATHQQSPPLDIPTDSFYNLPEKLPGVGFRGSPYYAVDFVPGETLSYEEIRQFSAAQRAHCGRKLGEFVAWLGDALPLTTYSKKITQLRGPMDYDIEHWTLGVSHQQEVFESTRLKAFLDGWSKEYWKYKQQRLLEPDIVGHDDLFPANLVQRNGRLSGVIDFERTKPTSLPRQFIGTALMGDDVCAAAAAAYEAQTAQEVPRELIDFWTRTLLVRVVISHALKGRQLPQEYARFVKRFMPEWSSA